MNNFFCSWPLLQLDNVAVSSALRIKGFDDTVVRNEAG